MDLGGYEGNGADEDQEASNSQKGKRTYHRHNVQQIQQLETFFKECPHPDEKQRRQLSRELGLESRQVKFWFQNKRTQTKTQHERADNYTLRTENEKIQCENLAIREALKTVTCHDCGGQPFRNEEQQHNIERLHIENAQLKQEHERVSILVSKFLGKPVTQVLPLSPALRSSMDFPVESYPGHGMAVPSFDLVSGNLNNPTLPYQLNLNGIQEIEKSLAIGTAVSAMDELIKLLRVNEPVWYKSPTSERYVLHRDSYDKLSSRVNHFKNSSARIESSKYSGVVMMPGMRLVDMFLDSAKWVDLFPTIVTKARTIEVIDTGMLGNQDDSLQLIYEQMHILSPLVAPREFFFLRFCRQLEPGVWVVVDVSYDYFRENPHSPLRTWKLPSGCMIQDMSNGCSRVTWVELVEVDDKSLTHRLYRDLVFNSSAYGAERWVVTLQRMCLRLAYSMGENSPSRELGGVINNPDGKRSIMQLSHRMMKNFCSILSMSNKVDFPHFTELNNSGVRVSVRMSDEPGQPSGMVVSAATSLWLPLSWETLYNFFRDMNTRSQWDVLSSGSPVHEIANISMGTHPENSVYVIQPFVPNESNMLILQENCVDSLGALVVYAPLDIPAVRSLISGEDSASIQILPSGFTMCGSGCLDKGTGASASTSTCRSCGSLLTVAFQILVCTLSSSKQLNMDSVATVNTLISSTVQKIKAALDCTNVD